MGFLHKGKGTDRFDASSRFAAGSAQDAESRSSTKFLYDHPAIQAHHDAMHEGLYTTLKFAFAILIAVNSLGWFMCIVSKGKKGSTASRSASLRTFNGKTKRSGKFAAEKVSV